MKKIAILHTTPLTVASLGGLIREREKGIDIMNFVDDSILPQLSGDSAALPYIYEKLLCYAAFAQKQGAQVIFEACSSVGGFCPFANDKIKTPILRIDDPVTDQLVKMGKRLAVIATMPTTLEPSTQLVREKAGKDCVITPYLAEGAFARNSAGDKESHDRLVLQQIEKAAAENDGILLAQASMASAAGMADKSIQKKILTSVGPAIDRLFEMLGKENGHA